MESPVYLFTGPEFGKRNDETLSVKNAFKKKLGDVDEHVFYLLETPFSQVMTILQSGTLFSSGVCVVCKNAELLKKKEETFINKLKKDLSNYKKIVDGITDKVKQEEIRNNIRRIEELLCQDTL